MSRLPWLLLYLVATSAACNAVRAETAPTSPAGATPFVDSLRDASGGSPVLFLIADGALQARSADGKLKREIAPGPVQEAVYDPALDLIWIRREGRLEIVDLRQPKPAPVPIVADMGDEGEFIVQTIDKRTLRAPGTCVIPGSIEVKWAEVPALKVRGFDEGEPPKPRLVGAAWLAGESKRSPRAVKVTQSKLPAFGTEPITKLPKRVGKCAGSGRCGTAVPFGASGWQLVFAGEDEGEDCRHYRCLLHDPATGKFGKPSLPVTWSDEAKPALIGACGLYRFDASGKWYAIEQKICQVGGACQSLKGAIPLGWLDGEQDVGTSG